jgi:hypothetical protein
VIERARLARDGEDREPCPLLPGARHGGASRRQHVAERVAITVLALGDPQVARDRVVRQLTELLGLFPQRQAVTHFQFFEVR